MDAVPQDTQERSSLSRIIPAIVAISIIGLLTLIIGDLAGAEGADEGEDGSAFFDVAWIAFSLGAIVSLILGLVALLTGRRRGRADDARAGRIGIGYFLLAVVVTALTAALL